MDKKIFECETITPLFLGGADGTTAELRPPSIKGMMRFWWRALHGDLSIPCLKEKEGKIFGSSDEKIGRSKFNIRVKPHNLETSREELPSHPVQVKNFEIKILDYLCYGTYERKNGKNIFIRDYIDQKEKFSIIITSHYPIHNDIEKSLIIMSTFGGLGSKSRNGFGSFKILKIDNKPGNFYYKLEKNNFTPELPKYSAFSQNVRLWKTKNSDGSWDESLAELGKIYRSGRLNLENKHSYKKRQYIGAPIIVKKIQKSHLDRHSKPYFMSVHHENDSFTGYILYLPSEYAYGLRKEKFDNEKETENFTKACKKLNDYFENDNNLEEVPL